MWRICVLVLAVALAGCAGATTDATPGTAPSATAGVAAREGRLAGDAQLEGGCVWLDTGDERIEVVWPQGYRATADPVELRDPTGAVIATEGDRLALRGRPATDLVSTCQVGGIWQATEVAPLD